MLLYRQQSSVVLLKIISFVKVFHSVTHQTLLNKEENIILTLLHSYTIMFLFVYCSTFVLNTPWESVQTFIAENQCSGECT